MRKLYVETTRSEILGARKCFICFECRWQPKLPGTLPDISLPLTVIGGYSDSNGIPTSTSDRSPSLLCTHVYNYTGSATPPPPPPSIKFVDSSSDKLGKLGKKWKEKRRICYFWELIIIIGQEFYFHERGEEVLNFRLTLKNWWNLIEDGEVRSCRRYLDEGDVIFTCESRSKMWNKIC